MTYESRVRGKMTLRFASQLIGSERRIVLACRRDTDSVATDREGQTLSVVVTYGPHRRLVRACSEARDLLEIARVTDSGQCCG